MPDSSAPFEYAATAEWSMQGAPDVTSVTIDGSALPSGTRYMIDERYATYADALASRVSHPIVVTTSSATLTFTLQMLDWPCKDWMTAVPITKQAEHFSLYAGLDGRLMFGAYDGSCENSDGRVIEWTTRTR